MKVRLEFIRQLSSELETMPDLDDRIETIQQALNRYPTESQLSQLLRNAQATRDFFAGLVAEARQEEMHDRYPESLKRWYVIRDTLSRDARIGRRDPSRRVAHTQSMQESSGGQSSSKQYPGSAARENMRARCINASTHCRSIRMTSDFSRSRRARRKKSGIPRSFSSSSPRV